MQSASELHADRISVAVFDAAIPHAFHFVHDIVRDENAFGWRSAWRSFDNRLMSLFCPDYHHVRFFFFFFFFCCCCCCCCCCCAVDVDLSRSPVYLSLVNPAHSTLYIPRLGLQASETERLKRSVRDIYIKRGQVRTARLSCGCRHVFGQQAIGDWKKKGGGGRVRDSKPPRYLDRFLDAHSLNGLPLRYHAEPTLPFLARARRQAAIRDIFDGTAETVHAIERAAGAGAQHASGSQEELMKIYQLKRRDRKPHHRRGRLAIPMGRGLEQDVERHHHQKRVIEYFNGLADKQWTSSEVRSMMHESSSEPVDGAGKARGKDKTRDKSKKKKKKKQKKEKDN